MINRFKELDTTWEKLNAIDDAIKEYEGLGYRCNFFRSKCLISYGNGKKIVFTKFHYPAMRAVMKMDTYLENCKMIAELNSEIEGFEVNGRNDLIDMLAPTVRELQEENRTFATDSPIPKVK